jgi:hypothetical protein
LESEEESAEVLAWRVCKEYSHQTRRESIAKAAMDDMWEFPATGPERKLGSLFADGVRFLNENRQVVWQLTYRDEVVGSHSDILHTRRKFYAGISRKMVASRRRSARRKICLSP